MKKSVVVDEPCQFICATRNSNPSLTFNKNETTTLDIENNVKRCSMACHNRESKVHKYVFKRSHCDLQMPIQNE